MHKIVTGVLVLIALLGVYAYFTGSISFGARASTGPTHQQKESFIQGLSAGTRDQWTVDNTGKVTSTRSTFCMNFFATSTATQNRMVASSTATIEGVDGVMMMQYGLCP